MKNFSVPDLMEMGAQFQKDRKIQISNDTKTIRALYQLYLEKKLILQDWFQRGFHWDNNKKVMLIHTLLNTPKLLTEVVFFIDEDGVHYVADGQQRLTSIFSFLDGEFEYNSPDLAPTSLFRGVKFGTKDFQKCSERLKDTPIKTTEIDNFGLDGDKVNILKSYVFMKWNNGSNLNSAELRGGLYSTVNDIVKPLVAEMDDTTKQALILSKKFGRNKVNELLEKLIYHMISKDLSKDPSPKVLMQMHGDKSIDTEQSNIRKVLNAVKDGVVMFKNQNKTYQAGATSMRDIMVAAIKLKKNNRLSTVEDVKNFIFNTMKTINSVYATNKKFKAYYKADVGSMDEIVNQTWFQPYFSYFGRGQDAHTAKRVSFLMDKMDEFLQIIPRDKNRTFPLDMQIRVLESQNNKCTICGQDLNLSEAEADHKIEHSLGGLTEESNCQMVHKQCHKEKTRNFMKEKNLIEVE